MLKEFAVLGTLIALGGYAAGVFGPSSYSRTVSRSPAEVRAALEKLDVTAQPGAPGSTAAAAGGIKPLFRLAEQGDRMTWYVMSGDKVATAMTAELKPADGGKATLITTNVQRGDAPDDFVSPAFRSRGVTMALFGAAIESRVNLLTTPQTVDADTCRKLFDRFAAENMAAQPVGRRSTFGDGVRQIMRINAMEPELRRHGCNTNADGTFRTPEQRYADGDKNAYAAAGLPDPGTSGADGSDPSRTMDAPRHAPRPDEPMIDPRPTR